MYLFASKSLMLRCYATVFRAAQEALNRDFIPLLVIDSHYAFQPIVRDIVSSKPEHLALDYSSNPSQEGWIRPTWSPQRH
jgi:hypothetical protein